MDCGFKNFGLRILLNRGSERVMQAQTLSEERPIATASGSAKTSPLYTLIPSIIIKSSVVLGTILLDLA